MSKPALDALWQDLALDAAGENPRLSQVFRAQAKRRKVAWAAYCSLALVAAILGAGLIFLPRNKAPIELTESPPAPATGESTLPPGNQVAAQPQAEKLVDFGVLSDEELEAKLGTLNLAVVGSGEAQRVIFLGKLSGH